MYTKLETGEENSTLSIYRFIAKEDEG